MSFKTNNPGVLAVITNELGSSVQAHDDLLDDISGFNLSGNAGKVISVNSSNNGLELSSSALGTAAFVDTGTEEGDVALLGVGGVFDSALIPSSAIDDLSNVTISSVSDKEVLIYDSGTSQWVNGSVDYNDLVNTPNLDTSFVKDVLVKTDAGSVTVASTDHVIIINKGTGEATSVSLPAAPATGKMIVVKDGKGDAATNNITISPDSGTIDGSPTVLINQNYESVTVVYNGTQWNII